MCLSRCGSSHTCAVPAPPQGLPSCSGAPRISAARRQQQQSNGNLPPAGFQVGSSLDAANPSCWGKAKQPTCVLAFSMLAHLSGFLRRPDFVKPGCDPEGESGCMGQGCRATQSAGAQVTDNWIFWREKVEDVRGCSVSSVRHLAPRVTDAKTQHTLAARSLQDKPTLNCAARLCVLFR